MNWIDSDIRFGRRKYPAKVKKRRNEGITANDGVTYKLPRCPDEDCLSFNLDCYSTREHCRYYECRDCGLHFKAVEVR